MKDSLALTIFAGVSVFILSQFIMKFVIDPVVSLKEALGELSHFFLKNQAKITNARSEDELVDEVKRLSAQLLAKKEAVVCYSIFSWVLGMPKENSLLIAARELNQISYLLSGFDDNPAQNRAIEINKSMNIIQKEIGTRITYS
jgi:hypothetical protein